MENGRNFDVGSSSSEHNKPPLTDMTKVLEYVKVGSEETRLRILMLLDGNPMCVQDLQEALNMSQPAVSYHVRNLRDDGFINFAKKDGFQGKRIYGLTLAGAKYVDWLEQIINLMQSEEDALPPGAFPHAPSSREVPSRRQNL